MSHSDFINSLKVTTALRKTVLRFSFESVQGLEVTAAKR